MPQNLFLDFPQSIFSTFSLKMALCRRFQRSENPELRQNLSAKISVTFVKMTRKNFGAQRWNRTDAVRSNPCRKI